MGTHRVAKPAFSLYRLTTSAYMLRMRGCSAARRVVAL